MLAALARGTADRATGRPITLASWFERVAFLARPAPDRPPKSRSRCWPGNGSPRRPAARRAPRCPPGGSTSACAAVPLARRCRRCTARPATRRILRTAGGSLLDASVDPLGGRPAIPMIAVTGVAVLLLLGAAVAWIEWGPHVLPPHPDTLDVRAASSSARTDAGGSMTPTSTVQRTAPDGTGLLTATPGRVSGCRASVRASERVPASPLRRPPRAPQGARGARRLRRGPGDRTAR